MDDDKRFHIKDERQFVDTDMVSKIFMSVPNEKNYDELWEEFSKWCESRWSGANMKITDNVTFTRGCEHVTQKMIKECFGKEFFKGDAVW